MRALEFLYFMYFLFGFFVGASLMFEAVDDPSWAIKHFSFRKGYIRKPLFIWFFCWPVILIGAGTILFFKIAEKFWKWL